MLIERNQRNQQASDNIIKEEVESTKPEAGRVSLPFVILSIPEESEVVVQENFMKNHILVETNVLPILYSDNHVFADSMKLQENFTDESIENAFGESKIYWEILNDSEETKSPARQKKKK